MKEIQLDKEFNDNYYDGEEIDLTGDDLELFDDSNYCKFNADGFLEGEHSTIYSSLEKNLKSISNCKSDAVDDGQFRILVDNDSNDTSLTDKHDCGGDEDSYLSKQDGNGFNGRKISTSRNIKNNYVESEKISENGGIYSGYYLSLLNSLVNYINIKIVSRFLPKMTKEEHFQFLLAYTSYMVLYSTRKPFSVVKLQIQDDLTLPTFILGWIDTAFLGSYALGQLVLPSLFESLSINKYLCYSFILSSISSLVFGLSSNSISLLSSWFLNGLFHAGAYPMLVKYLIQCFGLNDRGKILSVWTTSQQLGAILSTGFSASICSTFGWRSVFYIPSVLVFSFGIFIYRYLKCPVNNYMYEESVKIIMMKDTNNKANASEGYDKTCFEKSHADNYCSYANSDCSYGLGSSINITSTTEDTRNNMSSELVSSNSSITENISIQDDYQDGNIYPSKALVNNFNYTDYKVNGDLKDNAHNTLFFNVDNDSNTELSPIRKFQYKKTNKEEITMLSSIDNINSDFVQSSSTLKNVGKINAFYKTKNDGDMSLMHRVKELFGIKYILNISVSYFFVKLIRYSLLFWLPYYLIRVLNYDPSIAGYSSMLFDIGGIFGAISAGSIADSVFSGKRIVVALYMTIMISFGIINFIIATIFRAHFLILFGIMFMGFCISGPDSILGSTATQDILDNSDLKTKSIDSLATGLVNGLGSLGAVVQGILTAYVSEYYGWNSLFSCLILLSTISFLILLPINLNKKNSQVPI